jgi:glycosyltransferase involved in cell wall biosynthesis
VDSRALRVLEIIEGLDEKDGGPPEACLQLCYHLSGLGHEVALYTCDRNLKKLGRAVVERKAPNFHIHRFPALELGDYNISIPLAFALKKDVRSYNIVHINSLYKFSSTVAALYCRLYRVPYVVRPHGTLDPYIFRRHRLVKSIYEQMFEWQNLEHAAAVHFTAFEEMELVRPLRLKIRGVVVPLGVNANAFRISGVSGRFRAKWRITPNKNIILFLGRINFKKGLDLLVSAFSQISKCREDLHLVLAGPDGEGYGAKVRHWLMREGALSKTTFTGMVAGSDKLDILAAAQLFVLPSYTENFGLAVVEAMAAGLPVVISNKVNIWREIFEAHAGVVVNCDAEELAGAMERLLLNSVDAKEMGERGLRLVKERFTWERVAPQMIELYRHILSGHNGRS